jgi:shikimate dehydrogenase
MPLKESIIECLDEIDDDASLLRAVNSVSVSGGVTRGHNTDGDGCCDALVDQGGAELDGAEVIVLGAGGTARSVALALGRRGANVGIVNRTAAHAHALVDRLGAAVAESGARLRVAKPDDIASSTVLVNTTSVGMNSDECPVDASLLHESLVALDAVYSPMETALLSASKACGARTVDGLWMLVQQARRQFFHQFGVEPSSAALREAAERELARRRK